MSRHFPAEWITMATDEQVELAPADTKPAGSFYSITETPAQGAMQQHPFELVEMGGQVLGLELLHIGARGFLQRLRQLPQEFPPHDSIPQPPEIAGTGQASQGAHHRVKRARDSFLCRKSRQAGLDGAWILVQAINPKAQAPTAYIGNRLCLGERWEAKIPRGFLPSQRISSSASAHLHHRTQHMPALCQYPRQCAHAAAQGTKYPDRQAPPGVQATAPSGVAWHAQRNLGLALSELRASAVGIRRQTVLDVEQRVPQLRRDRSRFAMFAANRRAWISPGRWA